MPNNDNFARLPQGIRFTIFRTLPVKKLREITSICKQWNNDICKTENQVFNRDNIRLSLLGSKIYDEKFPIQQVQDIENQKFVSTSINTIQCTCTNFNELVKKELFSRYQAKINKNFFVYCITRTSQRDTYFILFKVSSSNIPQRPKVASLFCTQDNKTGQVTKIDLVDFQLKKLKSEGNVKEWSSVCYSTSCDQFESLSNFISYLSKSSGFLENVVPLNLLPNLQPDTEACNIQLTNS